MAFTENLRPHSPSADQAGRRSFRALWWARDIISVFGSRQNDGTWLIPLNQSDLNEHSGWSRSSGAVAAYLRALEDAVVSRKPLILDADNLDNLEKRWIEDRPISADAIRAGRDIALRFGRPDPRGTILVFRDQQGERPATIGDMAASLGLTHEAMSRRIQHLRSIGKLERSGRLWFFPEQTTTSLTPDTGPESAELSRSLLAIFIGLEKAADELRTMAARTDSVPSQDLKSLSQTLDQAIRDYGELHIPDPQLPGIRPC